MTLAARLLRRPPVVVALVAAVVLAVVALLVFEPWKLVVDQQVDEAVPVTAAATAAPSLTAAPLAPSATPAPQVRTLARGTFISHEHASSGTVRILQLADGSRVLRLEDLRTSNGPRLKVWLSDAPVVEGAAGWYLFDDGRHVDLGDLKGNVGSSNYPIPAGLDLGGLTSVSVWCDRFDVSFAAARLS